MKTTNEERWSSWRWSSLAEDGWPSRQWVGERLTVGSATWFARIDPIGAPSYPPLVLIHGLVVSGEYFRPVAMYLDDAFRLYVPDLPGFGRSSTGEGFLNLVQQADGLAAWMQAHSLSGAVLVGNSLGCQILTLLAVRHPSLVGGLVLVAPTMDPGAASPVALAVGAVRDIPKERQSLWSIWLRDFLRAGPRLAARSLQVGLGDKQASRLGSITQPVLVVGGERDTIISAEWIREMASQIPLAEAVILSGAAHAMNYSAPKQLARVIHRMVHQLADQNVEIQSMVDTRS